MRKINLSMMLLSAFLITSITTGCQNNESTDSISQVNTWKCDSCGHDGNTGKFCEECGHSKEATSSSSSSSPVESSSSESSPSESSTQTETSSQTDTSSITDTSSDDSSSSSTADVEEYTILVTNNGHCTASANYTKAAAGTTVTITVDVETGYQLEKIEVNGKAITGTSFEMEETSAVVNVYTTMVVKQGKYIDGDISANLIEEVKGSGLYVARNVKVSQDSYVCFKIDGAELSVTKLDTYKTFADVGLNTGHNGGFSLGGNSYYDFYYDANATEFNTYVQRVGVVNLPNSASQIESLFGGRAMSRSTVYPSGINGVTYSSSITGNTYNWSLYKDGSYATIKDTKTGEEQSIVYKKINGNNYKKVNTYVETENPSDKWVNDRRVNVSDLANKPFSANYDIVDTVSSYRYQMTPYEAAADSILYSHSVEALDMEMYNAYRSSYIGNIFNDVDVLGDTTVTSVPVGEDGGFKTTIASWYSWENSTWYSDASAYKTFTAVITFDKRGAIVSGEYSAYTYTDDYYDFKTKKLTTGWESKKADKQITFEYSYGDAKNENVTADVSKYFVNDITTTTVKGKDCEEGFISAYEKLNCADVNTAGESTSYNLVFDYAPSTALDAWQYGLIETKNPSIISNEYKGVGSGEAKVVIGNRVKNGEYPTEEVKVNVERNAIVRQFFIMTVGGYTPYYNDYNGMFVANQGAVYANNQYTVQIVGSATTGYITSNLGITFYTYTKDPITNSLVPNNDYVDLSFEEETGKLTIDTTKSANITSNVDVSIYMVSSLQIDGRPNSSIQLTIMPSISYPTDVLGTWTESKNNVNFTSSTEGTITYDGSTYDFTYTYDSKDGTLKVKLIAINKKAVDYTDYHFDMYIDSEDGALCVVLVSNPTWTSDGEDIIGYADGDDEWYDYYYEAFTKPN